MKITSAKIIHFATPTFLSILCMWLLALDSYGLVFPVDLRGEFNQSLLSYHQVLNRIKEARRAYGAAPRFYTEATHIYHDGTAYAWPAGLARIEFRDNWIMALAAYLDPLIYWSGFLKTPNQKLFSQFESFRYERALGRGFGICSQDALGLADLLYREYDDDIHVVGLNGHVVTQVTLPDHSQMILDPSMNVVLPHSIAWAESNLPFMRTTYSKTILPYIGNTFDAEGNFIAPLPGARPFGPNSRGIVQVIERASDVLIWVIPICGLLFVIFILRDAVKAHIRSSAETGPQAVLEGARITISVR
jgi:hypothetical protein